MKIIPFILLGLLVSCNKEVKEVKEKTETPQNIESENYTLETQNFFIDVPQGFAVNEMKIANRYAMKNYIKKDSLQYFLIASEHNHTKTTIDFNSDYIDSSLSMKDLNFELYTNYKKQFPKETLDISIQKDTILGEKHINYLVFPTLFNTKPAQTMYVSIQENNKIINLNFKVDHISDQISENKTFWNIVESVGLK